MGMVTAAKAHNIDGFTNCMSYFSAKLLHFGRFFFTFVSINFYFDIVLKIIVVTGPESVGKSTLCEQLSAIYNAVFIPEFARTYVEKLHAPYGYNDVEYIARHQIEELERYKKKYAGTMPFLFVDTYLIVTKIWFSECYHTLPQWLPKAIDDSKIDLYLLCKPDIEWQYDPVRENGSEKQRQYLYECYKRELEEHEFPFEEVSGLGDNRVAMCEQMIEKHFGTCV